MGLISDILKGRNKNNNGTHNGINMTSGNSDDFITPLSVAIGMLLTGKADVNQPKDLVGKFAEGKPETKNKGILGLLSNISNNTDIIVGGQNESFFSEYLNTANENADYLKNNFLKDDVFNVFIDSVKEIPNELKTVNTSLQTIVDTLQNNDEGAHGGNASIEVKGGTDIAAIFEALKNFTYDKKIQISLEQLAKDTSKGGRIEQLFINIKTLNEMEIDVEKFKNNLDKINEANNSTATAIGSSEASSNTESALKNLEGMGELILGVIGIGLLFVVVGLLAKWIDFAGIAMFAGILLVFVIALTGVFILASKLMKPGSGVMEGMESYMTLVAVAAVILIVGGLVMKFIDVSSLFAFAITLSIFLVMVLAPFIMYENETSQYDMTETYKSIVTMIIVASSIMILGSLVIGFINIIDLFKFTITLAIFLFAVLGTFALVSKLYKEDGAKGMKDAMIIIVGSAFLMFLGAAVMPALNIKNLMLFTFTLGLFLLVTLGVICLVSKLFKAEGKSAFKDALFLVVGAAFIMFLGAAIMPQVDYAMLILFTITLSLFLLAVMTPFLLLRPVIEHVKQAAIGVVLVVGISAAVLLIGGGLFLSYPGLIRTVPLFGAILATFVFLILWVYKKNAKDVKRAIPTAEAISILVGISAVILLGGGMLFIKYPELPSAVITFGSILAVFVTVMTGIVWALSKINSANLTKATLAMLGISGVLVIVSGAFMILAQVAKQVDGFGGMIKFSLIVVGAMGVLGVLTIGVLALAGALGNPPVAAAAYLAIGVVLAAASAFAIVALGFLGIAVAIEKLSKIKEFDVSPLVDSVSNLILLMYAMMPIIPFAPFLLMVEGVMFMLTVVISKIAETVKEYADLKIGIYKGTKLVGYRHLDTSDFEAASNNISLLVNTLTEGIMKAYDAHKEWYGGDVSALWAFAGPYGLIGAAIQSTQKSPLEKVIAQSKLLVPLISQIADAVKDYADLKVKIYEGTKHVGYRQLGTSDFEAASKNISLLVNALTEGIMKAYDAHKEWYGGDVSALWAFAGPYGLIGAAIQGSQKSPLEKVIAQSKMLGPLISKIGAAVGDIANLKMAIAWDKNGNPTEYKSLDRSDFKNASKNVGKVVVTLTKAIMNVYKKHSTWYDGGLFSDSPVINVINTNKKLAELISDVAASIKDYAELKMPTAFDKDGKPNAFEVMETKHFEAASTNVAKVLNTLGTSIMSVYDSHNDWYKDSLFSDSPFINVIETNTKLSKLISSVASGVKDYAELRMPEFDEQGNQKGYKKMGESDFIAAGKNIGLVVTTTAMGLMGYVPNINGEEISWTDGGAKTTIDEYILGEDEKKHDGFNRLLDASVKIGSVISSLADGISNFSKMMFPDYSGGIDEEGRPKKGYKELKSTDFTEAAKCITTVITTVADALIAVVNKDKALPEEQRMWNIDKDFEKSPLFKILSASEKMGAGITNIAEGLANYANMKFATGYDKDGKATGYERLTTADLKGASEKITDVITLVADTMVDVYEKGKQGESGKNMWDVETNFLGMQKSEMSPFERVLNASSVMGTMIENMAKGIVMFAGGNMGSEDKPVIINDTTLNLAKKSVTDVLKSVAETIAELATGDKTKALFEPKNNNTEKVLNGLMKMTQIIGGAAKSIQMFAALSIPTKWDENGKPTDFQKMGETEFKEASKNIKEVITVIGQSFNEVMADAQNSWLKDIDDNPFAGIRNLFENKKTHSSSVVVVVMNAIMKMAMTLSIMSGCIYGYATMRFPKGVNDNGHMEYSEPLSYNDIDSAKNNIVKIIGTLGQAMIDAVNSPVFLYMSSEKGSEELGKLDDYISSVTDTIVSISESVSEMVESESMKNLSTIVNKLETSLPIIEKLINNIAALMKLIFGGDADKYGAVKIEPLFGTTITFSFADLINKYEDIYENTSNSFETFIDSIIDIINALSNLDKPLNESYTKINSLHNLFENEQYIDKLRSIISNIGFMLQDMRKISQFDNLFISQATSSSSFGEDVYNFFNSSNLFNASASRQMAQTEIDNVVEKLAIYSDLILRVTNTLKKINSNVSNVKMANYAEFNNSIIGFFNAIRLVRASIGDISKEQSESIAGIMMSYSYALSILIDTAAKTSTLGDANFEVLTNGIISINESISNINENALTMFRGQTTQLEKFVKSVNTIKLLNISSLNKFVTSLNQLANKMGNLDKLTEAIANKLSGVLEKLVQRLVHAEQTIVKADEIQKRRHELIQKSVKEVSELMKQPMTIEVQATSTGSQETPAGGDASANGQNTNSTTTNR